jgi:hypothetical protein
LVEFQGVPAGIVDLLAGNSEYAFRVTLKPADEAGAATLHVKGRGKQNANRFQLDFVVVAVGSSVLHVHPVPSPAPISGEFEFSTATVHLQFNLLSTDEALPLYIGILSVPTAAIAEREYEATNGKSGWRTQIGTVIGRRPKRK